MKLVLLTAEQIGQTLAMPIFNDSGIVFLNRGKVLTERLIQQLQKIGIASIYVETPYVTLSLEEMIPSDIKGPLIKKTKLLFTEILKSQIIDELQVNTIIDTILENLAISENAILINNIVAEDDFAASCINAIDQTVYALLLGLAKEYPAPKLKELAITAFLHNLNQSDTSSTHRMIKNSTSFSATISTSILYSYESVNGSGPFGKNGTEFYEYAKIIKIARDYVQLINGGKLPHEAVEILFTGSGTLYELELIHLFTKNIYCYPNGLPVILNNGLEGIVVKQNISLPTRPAILVQGKNIINLQNDLTTFIDKVAL